MITERIHITGLVQGVGFRPFIYRIANELALKGVVENRNDGVFIKVSSTSEKLDRFVDLISKEAPPASRIDKVERTVIPDEVFDSFDIIKSENVSDEITGVSPDIACCTDCLSDLEVQEHRLGYPFINCTNCGPRFSIIKHLPYDRSNTTMNVFEMCEICRKEYEDIADRRFHAQPVACNTCGPQYFINSKTKGFIGTEAVVSSIVAFIKKGQIVALKGLGGYHLICDAGNEEVVEILRIRKGRDGKPFAVMSASIEDAKKIAEVNDEEEKLLSGWQRPIVLLKSLGKLAPSVSNSLDSVGIVLPYMPVHYMLFGLLSGTTLVFTSANLSEEPVVVDDDEALLKLGSIADIIVSYNRSIHNRTDDSVVKVQGGAPVILRRSRGYTPSAIATGKRLEGIFASGAELVNSFAIGKGEEAILSQYIGDLKNNSTLDFYKETYKLFASLFRFKPDLLVRDLHPDYLSSRFAENLSDEFDIPLVSVQHHHAHIASCMAENRLDRQVIGISLDGVGLGTDGNIWGGEIIIADYKNFERVFHFDYVPIVGADSVSDEPWRSGLAYLYKYYPDKSGLFDFASGMGIDEAKAKLFFNGIDSGINSHLYSSAGRLFDAVSSIIGVNFRSSFHAEAPMRLESIIDHNEKRYYDYALEKDHLSFGPAIEQIVDDVNSSVSPSIISARFHNTLVSALAELVGEMSQSTGLRDVVLSGGTFQNRFLTDKLFSLLKKYNYNVHLHKNIPPNDGGIALGQLVIAAGRMREN